MELKNKILTDVYDLAEVELAEKRKFTPGKTKIPATFPDLQAIDVQILTDCVLGYWYTEHKWAKRFKDLLTDKLEKSYATLTNSGSSASLAAMTTAIRMANDDRELVLTCATGFPTTVAPIYQNGKFPYYIDIDPYTLLPDLGEIEQALKENGDQICGAVFAHTLGFPFHEDIVWKMLGQDRFLIADSCDALGSLYESDFGNGLLNVGAASDFSTYSFFPAHHILSGEGGAVLCDIQDRYDMVQKIVSWGRSCFCRPGEQNTCGHRFDWEDRGDLPEGWDHKYIFDELGYNLKMTDLQAALGFSQLSRIDQLNKSRWDNYSKLRDELDSLVGFIHFVNIPEWSYPSPFGFPMIVPDDAEYSLVDFINHLQSYKIETRRVFGGNLIRQPGFKNLRYMKSSDLSGADKVMNDVVWISCSPTLTQEMIDYMIGTIQEFFI